MLRLLNSDVYLENVEEIKTLALLRIKRYLNLYNNSNHYQIIKLESDIYIPEKWEFQKEIDTCTLYTSVVPDSDYLAIWAETEVKCSVSNARKYLFDCSKVPDYNLISDKKGGEILTSYSKQFKYIHYASKNIYGISPRHFFVYNGYKKQEDGSEIIYSISSDEEIKDGITAKVICSGYHIIPLTNDCVKIIMIYHSELGGLVPSVAVNTMTHDDTIKILYNIKKNLESIYI
jgi:hypothetical protein